MNKIFSVFLLLIIFAFADHVDTGIAKADKAKSNITYHMVHPLHSWKGVSNDVEGTIQYDLKTNQIIHTEIVAPVSSFNSKNTSRDSRMTVLTEASKYPNVSFVSSSIQYNGSNLAVVGIITFHGINKQIKFTAKEDASSKNKTVSGEFTLLMEDFKLERPSLLMMKTNNEFTISFSMDFPLN